MPVVMIIIVVVVVGFLLWLAEKYVPMDATIKRILEAIVIIALVIWLLQVFGIWAMIMGATV